MKTVFLCLAILAIIVVQLTKPAPVVEETHVLVSTATPRRATSALQSGSLQPPRRRFERAYNSELETDSQYDRYGRRIQVQKPVVVQATPVPTFLDRIKGWFD